MLRIRGKLWIFENCVQVLNKNELLALNDFETFKHAVLNEEFSNVITLSCVIKASKINEYLIKHKSILSRLLNSDDDSIDPSSTQLPTHNSITPLSTRKQQSFKKSLERIILLNPGKLKCEKHCF